MGNSESILAELSASSAERAEQRKDWEQIRRVLQDREHERYGVFAESLRQPGLSVVAEFKKRSPSKGLIRENWPITEAVRAYERGGASAISVLTEETRFGGSLEDLAAAARETALPTIRKDFITDPLQLIEARAAGADAALLIVAAFTKDDQKLEEMRYFGQSLGLEILLEVHDPEDLARALTLDPEMIGINNRNLNDPHLSTDIQTTWALLDRMPPGVVVVTESGYTLDEYSLQQLEQLSFKRVDAVLIGEALMRSPKPEAAVRRLTAL